MTAVLDSLVVGPCKDCGGLMLGPKTHRLRRDLRAQGYLRHGGYGLCRTDYSRARRFATLPNPAPKPSSGPRVPRVSIQRVYPVECARCGEIARVDTREEAVRAQLGHREAHRRGEIRAVAS